MNRFDLLKQTNTDLAARIIIEFGKRFHDNPEALVEHLESKPASGKSTWKKEGRTTPNGTIDISINLLRKREEVRPWETHFIRCR